MMFTPTPLAGSYVVGLKPFSDQRGWFARFFSKDEFMQIGHHKEWLQMNHSMTYQKASIRGMHFQLPPFAEIKLVRCVAGTVYDVIIDLRKNSPTFLKWFGVELSEQNQQMLYIPEGFAHGFQTLSDNCQLIYHHSEMYTPTAESGLKFNDPMVAISWPMPVSILSERDAGFPPIDASFKGL